MRVSPLRRPETSWAHARRYFIEALKALGLNPNKLPLKAPDKARRPLQALTLIRQLYALEHRVREQISAARQAENVPVLTDLHAWLVATLPKVLPGSPLGRALGDLERHWTGLVRYCDDGRLEIDNNRCENAIRPFVVGRKNWLFSDTLKGAQSSANLYSLIETAKAWGASRLPICVGCSRYCRQRRPSLTSKPYDPGPSRRPVENHAPAGITVPAILR